MIDDTPKDLKRPETPKRAVGFWESWHSIIVVIGLIIVGRFLIFEPFKIPSGSMEPTLIGHVDYGDRIATNRLAYQNTAWTIGVLAVMATLLVAGLIGSWASYRGLRRVLNTGVSLTLLALFTTGTLVAWNEKDIAGEPKRFDTVVFKYDPAWKGEPHDTPKNYIKRLVGLPGDTLLISGGDLFLKDRYTGKVSIVRKSEYDPQLQETLWQPVALCSFRKQGAPHVEGLEAWDAHMRSAAVRSENRASFPWNVASDAAAVERTQDEIGKAWGLDVRGAAELTYAFPITNVYCKIGRWPFRHENCPMASREVRVNGLVLRDKDATTQNIRPYVPNSWNGVRCPNCSQLAFPLAREATQVEPDAPCIVPDFNWGKPGPQKQLTLGARPSEEDPEAPSLNDYGDTSAARGTPYFYGGQAREVVGDLKLELELEVLAAGGALQIETGSDRYRAAWNVSLGGPVEPWAAAKERLVFAGEQVTLTPGRHVLTLAYVDGALQASLNGKVFTPQMAQDPELLGKQTRTSLARIRFAPDSRARVTRLDLFRDLYHTTTLDHAYGQSPVKKGTKDFSKRPMEDTADVFTAEIPENNFMVLGDNSPSSTDSRVWGFVPRENLIGRASFVWWPPSRWRRAR